jgi:hypothetical protein
LSPFYVAVTETAYLEATSPRNRAFYERNGFEVIEQCTYARGAITTWRMWREPIRSHDALSRPAFHNAAKTCLFAGLFDIVQIIERDMTSLSPPVRLH